LLVAEMSDRARLAVELDAHVPVNWPEGVYDEGVIRFFLERLDDDPNVLGWWSWYGVLTEDDDRYLVTGLGFKGSPRKGSVEIGYGVVEEFRGRGIAREAAGALIAWAWDDSRVRRVVAETTRDNFASMHVLKALGFNTTTPTPMHLRYFLERPH
jgi:ribosomal-protein-alanine N-acetyltransferase